MNRADDSTDWPLLLYALTGFTGLLAEQGFEKYISLLVGATASASAVVIFAYFLGFALGSWVAGECIKRGRVLRPLRLYGVLELAVGISCIAFTLAFHPLVQRLAPFQAYYADPVLKFAVRFAFGSILILPTAGLMGASFPLIAQVVDRQDSSGGRRWTEAYAMNLAGAAAAAFVGSYGILPVLGIRGSFWLCFGIGAVVCGIALSLPEPRAVAAPQAAGEREKPGKDAWLLLGAAFASGLAFFALEIIWTHLIAAALGCSIYAFSSMLGMVLVGLLIGAFRVRRVLERQTPIVYSKLFQFCALLLIVQFRCWDMAQALFAVRLPHFLQSFYAVESYKLLIAALLIVPSAALLGAIYPQLLGSTVLKGPGRLYLVGYLNTFNSIGCLTGALLGIFFLIPVLGSEVSMKAIVAVLLVVASLFLWRERPSRKAALRGALGSVIVLAYVFAWKWDRRLLTSGLNIYFGPHEMASVATAAAETGSRVVSQDLIYFHEAAQGGMTTVVETTFAQNNKSEKVRSLYTNGKFEGDDSDEGEAQIGLSVIPSLFVGAFDRALLIGLGTGHSALALKKIGYNRIDIAEFAPGIVDAATNHFSHLNEGVLRDPAVRLSLEDGRNVLLTETSARYDLITIELASIWFSGATNLYSTEFYALAKSRLKPDGVLQQWVQLHHISSKEVASAIASVRSLFPSVSLWYFGGQGMIVASDRPQVLDGERLKLLTSPVQTLMKRPGDGGALLRRIPGSRLVRPAGIDRMIAAANPVINTDHNRWIEYATPRYNWSDYDWRSHNLAFLSGFEKAEPAQTASAR